MQKFSIPDDAGMALAHLGRLIELSLERLDLTLMQYRLLRFLASESPIASVLAEYLDVSPPSITLVADSLVERGLIEKQPDAADRRRVIHSLTTKGAQTLQNAADVMSARLREVASFFDDERVAEVASVSLALWLAPVEAHTRAAITRDRSGNQRSRAAT